MRGENLGHLESGVVWSGSPEMRWFLIERQGQTVGPRGELLLLGEKLGEETGDHEWTPQILLGQ